MARLFGEPTKTVFSTKKETTFGVAHVLATSAAYHITHENDPLAPKTGNIITDAGEYSNSVFLSEYTVERYDIDFTHVRRLQPHDFALFMSLLLGSTTPTQQGGTTAWKHRMLPDNTTLDLLSVTMWQETPVYTDLVWPGICCGGVTLDLERGSIPKLSADLLGIGSGAAGVDIAASAKTGETWLYHGDVDILLGGTYTKATGTVASGVSIASTVRSAQFRAINNAERLHSLGGTNAIIKGDLKALGVNEFSMTFEPAAATYLTYLTAGTETVLEIKIVGEQIGATGYYYTVGVIFPRARVTEVSRVGKEGSVQVAELTIEGLKDVDATRIGAGTDWPAIDAYAINQVTEYLGAVA
jgi:hypothetical protein